MEGLTIISLEFNLKKVHNLTSILWTKRKEDLKGFSLFLVIIFRECRLHTVINETKTNITKMSKVQLSAK